MSAALDHYSAFGKPAQPVPERFQSGVVPRQEDHWLTDELAREGIDLAQLSYGLSSPRTGARVHGPSLEDTYRFWTKGQGALSAELNSGWSRSSDEFSRQDEWASVTYGGECVGLSAFRFVDSRHPFVPDDSYFHTWPDHARQQLWALGTKVCVGSNITVAPAWRGRFGEFSVKELLLSLAIERFLSSDADVMAGTMRNARGMNSLGYRLGARSLEADLIHPHYGVAVDLVVFERGRPRTTEASDVCAAVTEHLWNKTTSEGSGR
jgi:hypothetical protein